MAYLTAEIADCAKFIRDGGLVSFPTETVYGLGANALSDSAVRSIFAAKRRPLNDPVIVHVSCLEEALALILEPDLEIIRVYTYLASKFWPGPLTLVCRAAPHVPEVLMAGTGYVGIRCPNHPIALSLIRQSGVPIGAPSANLFSHVSPTTPEHVLKDFSDSDFEIKVIPGGQCSFGIESTVAKLFKDDNQYRIHILRKGGVSEDALKGALMEGGLDVVVTSVKRDHVVGENENTEAPGQMLKHYSPAVDTYIGVATGTPGQRICPLSEAAVIDFQHLLSHYSPSYHRNLSESGSVPEAINNLYAALRWTEDLSNVSCVLLPDLRTVPQSEFVAALWDRVFRSAAGREAVCVNGEVFRVVTQ